MKTTLFALALTPVLAITGCSSAGQGAGEVGYQAKFTQCAMSEVQTRFKSGGLSSLVTGSEGLTTKVTAMAGDIVSGCVTKAALPSSFNSEANVNTVANSLMGLINQ